MACIVKDCKSHRGLKGTDGKYISFHKFPTDKAFLNQWIYAVGREPDWAPKNYHTVCSEHFTSDAFTNPIIPPKHRKLIDAAVPTLHLPHSTYLKKEELTPNHGAYPTMLIVPLTPKCTVPSVTSPKPSSSKSTRVPSAVIDNTSDCKQCLQYKSQIQILEKKVEYLTQTSRKQLNTVNALKRRVVHLRAKNTEVVKYLELGEKIVIVSKKKTTPKVERNSIKFDSDS